VAKITVPRQSRMGGLKAIGAADVKHPAYVCLGHHQIIVGEKNVIIVLHQCRMLLKKGMKTDPFWALGIDPNRVAPSVKAGVITKIADHKVPIAAAIAHKPVRMQGFVAARTATRLRLVIFAVPGSQGCEVTSGREKAGRTHQRLRIHFFSPRGQRNAPSLCAVKARSLPRRPLGDPGCGGPPKSPDLKPSLAVPLSFAYRRLRLASPIEQVVAKLKHLLRKAYSAGTLDSRRGDDFVPCPMRWWSAMIISCSRKTATTPIFLPSPELSLVCASRTSMCRSMSCRGGERRG
jgi:hypothetical protein